MEYLWTLFLGRDVEWPGDAALEPISSPPLRGRRSHSLAVPQQYVVNDQPYKYTLQHSKTRTQTPKHVTAPSILSNLFSSILSHF